MLHLLEVRDFKAIGPQATRLALAPLTVIVGPSGSGKSSLLQALALTAQSAVEDRTRHDLVLAGQRVSVPGEVDELYCGAAASMSVRVDADASSPGAFPAVRPRALQDAREWPPRSIGYEWRRERLRDRGAFSASWSHRYFIDDRCAVEHCTQEEARRTHRLLTLPLARGRRADALETHADEKVLGDIRDPGTAEERLRTLFDPVWPIIQTLRAQMSAAFERISSLWSIRGNELIARETGPRIRTVGTHGEQTLRLLAALESRTNPAMDQLRQWCERFALPKLDSGTIQANELRAVFVDPITGKTVDLHHAASGGVQGLIIATQVLLAPAGSTLLVEEPECNMHPRLEQMLPQLFADALALGQQIISTTHSEILLAALGNAVRSKRIDRDHVAVYELQRTEERGTEALPIPIDDRGYLKGWIRSYAEVQEALFQDWARELPEERPRPRARQPRARGGGSRREKP